MPKTTDTRVPSSLHTVTAIVRVARFVQDVQGARYVGPNTAVNDAMTILGYADVADPSGLRAKALKAMTK